MDTECILGFMGELTQHGYRRYSHRPFRKKWVHRVAWEDANQACILPGFVVRHMCDTRLCINPKHLELGTPGDNNRDCVARGRHVSLKKLTVEQEKEIKAYSRHRGSSTELAKIYGVSDSKIHTVRGSIHKPRKKRRI